MGMAFGDDKPFELKVSQPVVKTVDFDCTLYQFAFSGSNVAGIVV